MSHSYCILCPECRDTWYQNLDWVHVVGSEVKLKCGAECGEYGIAYIVGHRVADCCT